MSFASNVALYPCLCLASMAVTIKICISIKRRGAATKQGFRPGEQKKKLAQKTGFYRVTL